MVFLCLRMKKQNEESHIHRRRTSIPGLRQAGAQQRRPWRSLSHFVARSCLEAQNTFHHNSPCFVQDYTRSTFCQVTPQKGTDSKMAEENETINQFPTFQAGLEILAGETLALSASSTHVPMTPILCRILIDTVRLVPWLCSQCVLVLFAVGKHPQSVPFSKAFTIFTQIEEGNVELKWDLNHSMKRLKGNSVTRATSYKVCLLKYLKWRVQNYFKP